MSKEVKSINTDDLLMLCKDYADLKIKESGQSNTDWLDHFSSKLSEYDLKIMIHSLED